MSKLFSCDVCTSTFSTRLAATKHKKATKHCFCQHCHKALASSKGLQHHNTDVHCHRCPQCTTTFAWRLSLTDHQKAQGHCYCGDCNTVFGTSDGFKTHMKSSRHSSEFRCCDCDRGFKSAAALDQHFRDKVHRRPAVSANERPKGNGPRHVERKKMVGAPILRCSKCQRNFATGVALQQHLASLVHQPLGKLTCFASTSCKAKFHSPSAVLHHLESGACPSGMNRDQIKNLILTYDTERLITKSPGESAASLADCSNRGSVVIRTPSSLSLSSSSEGCLTPTSGSLSEWAMLISQPTSHRCPFCPPGRQHFCSAKALQNHIQSAAHDSPFLYCPATMPSSESGKSAAIRKFTTVSGLAQHLESGACEGGLAGFRKAMKYMDACLQEMGMRFRLA